MELGIKPQDGHVVLAELPERSALVSWVLDLLRVVGSLVYAVVDFRGARLAPTG